MFCFQWTGLWFLNGMINVSNYEILLICDRNDERFQEENFKVMLFEFIFIWDHNYDLHMKKTS